MYLLDCRNVCSLCVCVYILCTYFGLDLIKILEPCPGTKHACVTGCSNLVGSMFNLDEGLKSR